MCASTALEPKDGGSSGRRRRRRRKKKREIDSDRKMGKKGEEKIGIADGEKNRERGISVREKIFNRAESRAYRLRRN